MGALFSCRSHFDGLTASKETVTIAITTTKILAVTTIRMIIMTTAALTTTATAANNHD